MSTVSKELIDAVARRSVSPLLRAHGFTRRGRRWNRPRGMFIDVIGLQASRASSPTLARCTINLGLFIPTIYCTAHATEAPAFVGDIICPIRTRLGLLTEDRHDRWWDFRALDGEISPDGNIIGEMIRDVGLPFFDRFNSLTDVHNWLVASGTHLLPSNAADVAAIKLALGDTDGARLVLQHAYGAPLLRDWIGTVAVRLGIMLTL